MRSRKMILGMAAAMALSFGFSGEGLAETEELSVETEAEKAETEAAVETGAEKPEAETAVETETQEGASTGQQDYADLGAGLSEQMAGGDFAGTVELFAKEIKAQLPEGVLKMVWGQTVASLGAYQEVYDAQQTFAAEGIGVKVTLRYEKGGLNVLFAFNQGGEITGLRLNYYNIPEEPDASEEYEEQKIKIGAFELDGRLTLPVGVEKPPVVILVQGSGQSDMNETIGAAGNQPFKDLAVGLAKRGIATIRYNKRYYQYPEKAPTDLTIQDEVLEDVDSAIQYAAECGQIDPERMIVLGHSLGGMLAPKIASDHEEVAGIISMAGSPRNLLDISADQNIEALAAANGLSDEEKKETMAQLEAMMAKAREASEGETEQIMGVDGAYWYSLNQIHTDELVKNLEIPMLFLQGDADFQVYPDKDYVLWQELLEGKENAAFHLYKGLNHLFMPTGGKRDITEYDAKAQVDEQVIADIGAWIAGI